MPEQEQPKNFYVVRGPRVEGLSREEFQQKCEQIENEVSLCGDVLDTELRYWIAYRSIRELKTNDFRSLVCYLDDFGSPQAEEEALEAMRYLRERYQEIFLSVCWSPSFIRSLKGMAPVIPAETIIKASQKILKPMIESTSRLLEEAHLKNFDQMDLTKLAEEDDHEGDVLAE